MTRKVGDNADPQLTDLFEVNSWFRSNHLRRTTRNDERTRELDDNEELLGLKAIKKLTMVPTSCLSLEVLLGSGPDIHVFLVGRHGQIIQTLTVVETQPAQHNGLFQICSKVAVVENFSFMSSHL